MKKKLYTLICVACVTSFLLGCEQTASTSTNAQTNTQSYKVSFPKGIGDSNIALTKQNRFVRYEDRVCVTKAYDERNGDILYKRSGDYIQKITFDKFAQHSPYTFMINSYNEQDARSEIIANNCSILVHPQIQYWASKTFDNKNIVVKIDMYDGSQLNLLNQATLVGTSVKHDSDSGPGVSTIDEALELYINWLYKN